MENLFAWNNSNKQHLSVGAVLVNSNQEVLVHKLGRIGNKYFLPKKSHSNNSTLEETLNRVEAEIGYKIIRNKYLGSRKSTFKVEDESIVNKTTLYFLCNITEQTQRDKNDRDSDSELIWLKKDELINIMKEQGKLENDLDESEILERLT